MRNTALQCLALICILIHSVSSYGQEIPKCRTYDALDILLMKYPHLRDQIHQDEEALDDYTANYESNRAAGDEETYVVPVVFHIIHENGAENISDEQILDAMYILNRDFAMENEDIEDVISEFQGIVSDDIKIEFKLAQRNPDGDCTNGIIRIESDETNEGGEDMKDLSRWPRNNYLNIWVCAYAQGAAGYSYLPASVNSGGFGVQNDGIVLLHNYTGSIETSNIQRSRTLTHEVGHWLNLRHPWGGTNNPALEENCNDDDGISDTPLTVGWQTCNLNGESCGSLDNVQNYMDYSFCSRMFTEGQKDRMRAALTSTTADRNELWTSENLAATGVLLEQAICMAQFSMDRNFTCAGSAIQFEDQSYHNPTEWLWDFGDGSPLSNEANPNHIYSSPGTYSVSLTVGNGSEQVTTLVNDAVTVSDTGALSIPLEEGFESYGDEVDESNIWSISQDNSSQGWELYDNTAYSGEQCVRIRNHSNNDDSDVDEIISSTFDFTGATEIILSYKWAFAQKTNETDDRLRVYVSNDCGISWSQRKLHRGFTDLPSAEPQGNQFIPDGQDEWNENTIVLDNDDYFGPSFRVKFRFENQGGGNIYLDDINIGTELSLSIDASLDLNNVSLYPNPTNGESILDLGSNKGTYVVSIFDSSGRLVNEITSVQTQISLSASKLSSGLYTVRISDGTLQKNLRWVVE